MRARKLLRRAHRDREGAFLIEGSRAVLDAIAVGANVEEIFVDDSASSEEVARAAGDVPVHRVPWRVLKALSDSTTPQRVVAIARRPETSFDALPPDASLVLVLAEVRDPGNAGTLVRSASGAGADAVVFTTGSVDPFSPKTVRASAASLLRLPVVTGSVAAVVARLRERGLALIGAVADAPTSCYDADLARDLALVVGNEAWGLPREIRDHLDEAVGIPMPGGIESLNAGIAGSILLFEAVRQRRLSSTDR